MIFNIFKFTALLSLSIMLEANELVSYENQVRICLVVFQFPCLGTSHTMNMTQTEAEWRQES